MLDPVIQYCLLGSFALMFAISAADKYKDRGTFSSQLTSYRLLPEAFIPLAVFLVPAAEITAATLLVTTGYKYGVALGSTLLAIYGLAIGINLGRGRTHIDCGCLGSAGEGISYFHVSRNLVLVIALGLCLLPVAVRELVWLDYFVIPLFVGASILIFASFGQLLASHMNQRLWWS